jgi:Ca2+/Na+ antiporter
VVDEPAADLVVRWVLISAWCVILADVHAVDMFEVALLVGACFLVNYVTADSKTNWVEGCIMVAFYLMIVSLVAPLSHDNCGSNAHVSGIVLLVLYRRTANRGNGPMQERGRGSGDHRCR